MSTRDLIARDLIARVEQLREAGYITGEALARLNMLAAVRADDAEESARAALGYAIRTNDHAGVAAAKAALAASWAADRLACSPTGRPATPGTSTPKRCCPKASPSSPSQ